MELLVQELVVARQLVVAVASEENVRPAVADQIVVARSTVQVIVAVKLREGKLVVRVVGVVGAVAEERVVALAAYQRVASGVAHELVVVGAPVQKIVALPAP